MLYYACVGSSQRLPNRKVLLSGVPHADLGTFPDSGRVMYLTLASYIAISMPKLIIRA